MFDSTRDDHCTLIADSIRAAFTATQVYTATQVRVANSHVFQGFTDYTKEPTQFDALMHSLGWAKMKSPARRFDEVMRALGWTVDVTPDDLDDPGHTKHFSFGDAHGEYISGTISTVPSGKELFVGSFFFSYKPSQSIRRVRGRTVAGIGMELVYLYAKINGCNQISLYDAWSSGGGVFSDDLMKAPIEFSSEYADMHRKIGERGRRYGFDTPGSLREFRKRVKKSGFYAAWNFSGVDLSKHVDLDEFIATKADMRPTDL